MRYLLAAGLSLALLSPAQSYAQVLSSSGTKNSSSELAEHSEPFPVSPYICAMQLAGFAAAGFTPFDITIPWPDSKIPPEHIEHTYTPRDLRRALEQVQLPPGLREAIERTIKKVGLSSLHLYCQPNGPEGSATCSVCTVTTQPEGPDGPTYYVGYISLCLYSV